MKPKAAIFIPSRMGSTRFPGKPKVHVAGTALLERVWRLAKASKHADEVFIATPDQEIVDFAEGFGARAVLTSRKPLQGTEAVAEAVETLDGPFEIIVNLLGDALLTPPWVIDAMIEEMQQHEDVRVVTPVEKLTGKEKAAFVAMKKTGSTSGTTMVVDRNGNAMYSSKGIIPFEREYSLDTPILHHIGLYAFRRETLKEIAALPESHLENIERLEHLRAMEHGIPLRVVEVDYRGRVHASVDHPEDVSIAESLIEKHGELLS